MDDNLSNLMVKIQDDSLDGWFEFIFEKVKTKNPDSNNKELINICFLSVMQESQLDYLIKKGADISSIYGKELTKRYFSQMYNKENAATQDKLVEILKENFLNQFKPNDGFYHTAYLNLAHNSLFSKKISKLDIDWAKHKYVFKETNQVNNQNSIDFLYFISKKGPSSAKVFLSSKSCFSTFNPQEKQDYIFKLSCYVYDNVCTSISSNQQRLYKKSILSLLNYLTSQMDNQNKNKLVDYGIKKGIPHNMDLNKNDFTWSVKDLSIPLKTPKKTFKKTIKKTNKTVSDVEFLKSQGFDFSSKEGEVFLTHALLSSNLSVCKKLVEFGVNPNATIRHPYPVTLSYYSLGDKSLYPCLDIASEFSNKNIVEFFLKKSNISKTDNKHNSSIFHATIGQKTENINFLVKNGVDINYKDSLGRNALWYIPISTHIDNQHKTMKVARVLIQNGIDPFHLCNDGSNFIEGYKKILKNRWYISEEINVNMIKSLHNLINQVSSYELKKEVKPSKKTKKRIL